MKMNWLPTMSAKKTAPIAIRALTLLDLNDVVSICNQHYDHPWGTDTWRSFLSQINCGAVVGVRDGQTIACASFMWRRTILDLSIAVHKEHLRQGVGRQFFDYFRERLHVRHRPQMVAFLRDYNLSGHLFCKSLGFECTGVIRGTVDTYIFRYRVQS